MPEYSLSTETPTANPAAAQPAPEGTTVQDNLARVAVLLDKLTKSVLELRERVAKTESQLSEIEPFLGAMKTHINSFPGALREVRRSDIAVHLQVEKLSSRVATIESRLEKGQPGNEHPLASR